MPIFKLRDLPDTIEKPAYERGILKPKILHMGFGAFARAHWMVYHQQFLQNTSSDWGVTVARLNSGVEELNALADNEHLYSVVEQGDRNCLTRIIGCICDTAHPVRDGLPEFLNRFADTDLSIVTLTITEKGYCSISGKLDHSNPGIAHDLAAPAVPKTAVGVLVEGLRLRREKGCEGVTILSLDNLPSNGRVCKQVVTEFAGQLDQSLAGWIKENVAFPCSMVDRIVPALSNEGRATIHSQLGGRVDPCGIVCEPFRQWVIEDSFVRGRPDWESAGAQFVKNVEPFEEMKLRMLNGTHSFLAYLGSLAGYATISDCMADPHFKRAALRLMLDEQAVTLNMPSDIDLQIYAEALIERFSNTKLKHRTEQIAEDGSQKLPPRMLLSIRRHIENGGEWFLLALGVAGWLRYIQGKNDEGEEVNLSDPLQEQLKQIASQNLNTDNYIDRMLEVEAVFPRDLADNVVFRKNIKTAFCHLIEHGVKKAVEITTCSENKGA